MLTTTQIEYADMSFGLYDHDWRFYAEFLGEPFLCGDCLAYFDGVTLFYCSFPPRNCRESLSKAALLQALAEFPYLNSLRGLDVWGRCESYAEPLVLCGRTFDLVQDYGESTMTDVMMDVLFFDFETHGEARRARNSAKNKDLVTSVTQPGRLCHEHISLMMKFFATHAVSAVHALFYLALTSLIKNPNIFIVEAQHEERLKGYAVLSLPNPSVVSLLMDFYDNTSGLRVSDGVYGQMIDWAKTRGMERLHFGYSATDSLSEYKKKWNANLSGPTYREAYLHPMQLLLHH